MKMTHACESTCKKKKKIHRNKRRKYCAIKLMSTSKAIHCQSVKKPQTYFSFAVLR